MNKYKLDINHLSKTEEEFLIYSSVGLQRVKNNALNNGIPSSEFIEIEKNLL